MLGRNTRSTLLRAPKNIILCQWTELGNYIVYFVCIGSMNTNIPPCLCHDMWRESCMNINTKWQHALSMHHTNVKEQIMGAKLSGQPMRVTNLSSYLNTENIYKR